MIKFENMTPKNTHDAKIFLDAVKKLLVAGEGTVCGFSTWEGLATTSETVTIALLSDGVCNNRQIKIEITGTKKLGDIINEQIETNLAK